jgi:hypothetical protein
LIPPTRASTIDEARGDEVVAMYGMHAGRRLSLRRTLAAVLLMQSMSAAADGWFGIEGGFEVIHNEHGTCEASRGLHYRDAHGDRHFAAMSFGLLIEQGHLLAMVGVYSQSLALPPGETWAGRARFDAETVDATFVADDARMLSAYMAPQRIADIARAHEIELTLHDGTRIALPLAGTFAASRLVADCYRAHLARRIDSPDPFAMR